MKKLFILFLVLSMAAPAFARRTDMMSSYGYNSRNSQQKFTNRKNTNHRYTFHKKCCDSDVYMGRSDRYMGDLYMSKAARMLYDNEHSNNYVDRNKYMKELRELELERRRRELEKSRR